VPYFPLASAFTFKDERLVEDFRENIIFILKSLNSSVAINEQSIKDMIGLDELLSQVITSFKCVFSHV
jgi:hypothetical protein